MYAVIDTPWGRLNPNIAAQYERSLKVSCPTCHQGAGRRCIVVCNSRRIGELSMVQHTPRIKKSWKKEQ